MNTITLGRRDIYQDAITVVETQPETMNIIINLSEIMMLPSCIDRTLSTIVAETVSTYVNTTDIYEMSLSAVSDFFESCGFKSHIDFDDYSLVNRIIGIESLFSMVEDIYFFLSNKIQMFCGMVKNFCLVKWIDDDVNNLEGLYWIDRNGN